MNEVSNNSNNTNSDTSSNNNSNTNTKTKKISNIKEIDNLDPFGYAEVTVKIAGRYLQEAKKNFIKEFGEEGSLDYIFSMIITEYNKRFRQQHTTSLLFEGREPRKDVLNKLKDIEEALNSDNSYPNFHINEIHRIIKSVLGNVDDRTVKKYVNCIKDFVKSATGLELGYNRS